MDVALARLGFLLPITSVTSNRDADHGDSSTRADETAQVVQVCEPFELVQTVVWGLTPAGR
jgi:hypothetical protein